jgi:hypothetical protein
VRGVIVLAGGVLEGAGEDVFGVDLRRAGREP